jgi:flagellar L-ring protein FlgH
MRQQDVVRIGLVVLALYGMCCVVALGQVNSAPDVPVRQGPGQAATTPAPPQHDPAAAMRQNGGSLLRATLSAAPDPGQAPLEAVSFFAVPEPEPRRVRKHDLVTIIIREQSEFVSNGSTELRKQAALQARIDELLRVNLAAIARDGATPGIDASGSRDFRGEGTVDRSDSFTARVQAEVIDVKPNGTLVLQGRKRIRTDEEEQQFMVTGICRAEDITADNTVLSTQLHDFDVQKTHSGNVRNATRRGVLPRLLDALNPF